MALFVVLVRVAFRIIFGGWSWDGIFSAIFEGSKLAAWVLGFGLLNLIVDFRKLLKRTPKSLRSFTTALNLALSLTPELARSVIRVREAAKLRALRRGIHFVRSIIVPVLSNAIDQAIHLADSMESRGFGNPVRPAKGGIELAGLNFSYPNGRRVLRNVNVSIASGQFTVIAGNTGSGKSTLLRVIGAKLPGIGFVNQFPRQSFVADAVFDELAFSLVQLGLSKTAIHTRVLEVANRFELDVNSNPLELSAGWQQRVAIAAALTSGSEILLLDEPFSALDESGTQELLKTLEALKTDGITVVVAEHRVKLLHDLADTTLWVESGNLRETNREFPALQSRVPNEGKVTVFLGENGSGKTTYLKKLANQSGVLVPQPASDLLFLETVAAELTQADLDANKPAGTARKQLEKFLHDFDEAQNPRDLSEGQKLILALSIQLSKDTDLLLLDEPTLGLDTPSRQQLADTIQFLANDGVEIVVATHDREFAQTVATELLPINQVVTHAS